VTDTRVPAGFSLAAVRDELPVTKRIAYLNAGTFGPLPRRTAALMHTRAVRDLELGRSGPQYFSEVQAAIDSTRSSLATMLGTTVDRIALTRSTTDACHIVVKGLRLGARDEIVTTDAEHFGLLGPLRASAARVKVARITACPASQAFDAIATAVGPRTRLIAVSHVAWSTGNRLPVERLRELGVPLLIDGAQSVGTIAVDVEALGCDFYAMSGQKWLLGPEVTGALYVRDDALARLDVSLPSYLSQESYEEDGRFRAVSGAARFDPPWVATAALEGLAASISWLTALGPDAYARASKMAERCRSLLTDRASVITEPDQSTLVSFEPRRSASEIAARMAAQGVMLREIPGRGWLRASVGFWTSDDDLERMVRLT
jgi:L-cysteine/cystine lyase